VLDLGQLMEKFVGHRANDRVKVELKLKDGTVHNGVLVAVEKRERRSGDVVFVADESTSSL
jgi:hypothetical protein